MIAVLTMAYEFDIFRCSFIHLSLDLQTPKYTGTNNLLLLFMPWTVSTSLGIHYSQ